MTEATMQMKERSEAIGRAQRALKALGEHPRSSKKELGHAREHLNACYSHGSSEHVWNAVAQVEAMAERRYGVPSTGEHRQLVDAAVGMDDLVIARRDCLEPRIRVGIDFGDRRGAAFAGVAAGLARAVATRR